MGICLGLVGSLLLSRLGNIPSAVSAGSVLLAFLFAVGVGLFFGIYPAMRAGDLDPIEALRRE